MTTIRIDDCFNRDADFEFALFHQSEMHDGFGILLRIANIKNFAIICENAGIADLPTTFGIKRCGRENDSTFVTDRTTLRLLQCSEKSGPSRAGLIPLRNDCSADSPDIQVRVPETCQRQR